MYGKDDFNYVVIPNSNDHVAICSIRHPTKIEAYKMFPITLHVSVAWHHVFGVMHIIYVHDCVDPL